jgi:hypothetical protein
MCAIALDPDSLPRNRYFWVYEQARARRAHGRAYALRRLHEQLVQLFGRTAPAMTIGEEERGVRIAYRDEGLSLIRRIHLSPLETSLLRLLLARDVVELPPLLQAHPLDRLRVAAALERIRTYPGLPDPSGWRDVLAPLAPAAAPSNTTE